MKSNTINLKNNSEINENNLSNIKVSSSINSNMNLDLINLLKEKLAMQIEINNYKMEKLKKNQINSNLMNNSENINKIIELNNQLKQQNLDMKNEINKLNSIIEKQNERLNNNNSQYEKNKNNFKCPNCIIKNEELIKLTDEKIDIMNAINELKKQLEVLKANEKKKKIKEEISKNEPLPNIEQYFILNNKFQLVDKDFNLWHMKKCNKFKEFKEKNENIYKNPEDLLKAFINYYENRNSKDNIEEINNYNFNINEIQGNEEFNLNYNNNEDISLSLSDNSN